MGTTSERDGEGERDKLSQALHGIESFASLKRNYDLTSNRLATVTFLLRGTRSLTSCVILANIGVMCCVVH